MSAATDAIASVAGAGTAAPCECVGGRSGCRRRPAVPRSGAAKKTKKKTMHVKKKSRCRRQWAAKGRVSVSSLYIFIKFLCISVCMSTAMGAIACGSGGGSGCRVKKPQRRRGALRSGAAKKKKNCARSALRVKKRSRLCRRRRQWAAKGCGSVSSIV